MFFLLALIATSCTSDYQEDAVHNIAEQRATDLHELESDVTDFMLTFETVLADLDFSLEQSDQRAYLQQAFASTPYQIDKEDIVVQTDLKFLRRQNKLSAIVEQTRTLPEAIELAGKTAETYYDSYLVTGKNADAEQYLELLLFREALSLLDRQPTLLVQGIQKSDSRRCAAALIGGGLTGAVGGCAGGIKIGKWLGVKGAAGGCAVGGMVGSLVGAAGAALRHC
jgi:hypothetical protein